MPTSTHTTYEFSAYFKQGDDFNHILRSSKNVSEALVKWAEMLEESAQDMRKLSALFEGTDIESNSDTHMVVFEGDETVLAKAAQENLLSARAWDADDDEG